MNFKELYTAVKNKEVVAVSSKDKKYRLFIASNDALCYFKPRSSRRGLYFSENILSTIDTFHAAPAPQTQEDKLRKQYNVIAKYKKMAQQATFTNNFIETCKNLPEYDEWVKDKVKKEWDKNAEPRQKGLFELGVTTGNGIDGRVISISRIAKRYPHYAARLREAIREKTLTQICSNVRFAGYDMSISIENNGGAVGEFMGYLSLEYKGTGNGYYYLLINDENFIGYDID